MSRSEDLSRWDPLKYLTPEESQAIDAQLSKSLKDVTWLLFWTGVSHDFVTRWAKKWNVNTLTIAMGPLMDASNPDSMKCKKGKKSYPKYVKGASVKFALYACQNCQVIVLTNPPPHVYSPRENSTYQELEEPILQGKFGNTPVRRIYYVHPTVADAAHVLYQTWPVNRQSEWNWLYGSNLVRKKKLQSIEWDDHLLMTTSQPCLKIQGASVPAALSKKVACTQNGAKEVTTRVSSHSKSMAPKKIMGEPVFTLDPTAMVKETNILELKKGHDHHESSRRISNVPIIDYSNQSLNQADLELFGESEAPSRSTRSISIMRCLAPSHRHSAPVIDLHDLNSGSEITVDLGVAAFQPGHIFIRQRMSTGVPKWWVVQCS